jgi:addiction module RelE/StbE family toxin
MRLRWTIDAINDLISHTQHIQDENPAAARQVAQAVKESLQRLLAFPNMGRIGDRQGTRELVVPPYVLVYRVKEDIIELLARASRCAGWAAVAGDPAPAHVES